MNFSSPGRRTCRPLLVLAALAVWAASGCGGPGKASVSGTVKYNGEPLPSGTITFISEAGDKQAKGTEIVDGKYKIPEMQAGPAKVTVTTTPPSTGGAPPGGAPALQPSGGAPAPAAPGKYVEIAKKYANPDQSGLTYEVKPGDQTKDFDLTP